MSENGEVLDARINLETGLIHWDELARHFARGVVLCVAEDEDLVRVASAMARDDRQQVEKWLLDGRLRNAETDDARGWAEADATLWAVVVAPWVLVQERDG